MAHDTACKRCGKKLRFIKWATRSLIAGIGMLLLGAILGIYFIFDVPRRTSFGVFLYDEFWIIFIGLGLLGNSIGLRAWMFGEDDGLCIDCITSDREKKELAENNMGVSKVRKLLMNYPDLWSKVRTDGIEADPYEVREIISQFETAREFEAKGEFGEAGAIYQTLGFNQKAKRLLNMPRRQKGDDDAEKLITPRRIR
jgi:hypothetical protein